MLLARPQTQCTGSEDQRVPLVGGSWRACARVSPKGPALQLAWCKRARGGGGWVCLGGPPGPQLPAPLPHRGCPLLACTRPLGRQLGAGAGGWRRRGGRRRRATRPRVYANPCRARLPPPLCGPSREQRRPLRGTQPLRSARRPGQRAPGAATGGGTRADERRGGAAGGRTPGGAPTRDQVETRGPRWAAAACLSGCAPWQRCFWGRRPRVPRSSRGPRRSAPPATASIRRDGARGCARGRTSKRGERRDRRAGSGRDRALATPLPPAQTARGGWEAPGTRGRASARAGAPSSGRLRG